MPTVPFSGVPSVAPELNPTPRYEANVRPESFGVNVAQAIHSMGSTLTGAGNEIYARGLAMQDLYNHTKSQEGDADFVRQVGQIELNYKDKMGKNAVEALPQYQKDIDAARKSIRDGLPNDMARKMYDSTTLRTFSSATISGATHAAHENKTYALNTAKMQGQAIDDQIQANPNDEIAFQKGLDAKVQTTIATAQLQFGAGPDSDITKELVAQAKSEAWAQRIKGSAKQEPIKAGKMLNEAVKQNALQGDDVYKTANLVQSAQLSQSNRIIAAQVSSPETGAQIGKGIIPIERAREAISQIESGGRYSLSVDTGSKHGVALGKYQVMSGFLPEFLQQAGMPPMTPQEFLKDHAAQDKLFEIRFGALMKETGSANGAAARWIGLGRPDAFGTDAPKYVTRFNAALAKNAPLEEKYQRGEQLAKEQAPDNVLLPEAVRTQILGNHNRDVAAEKNEIFTTKNTLLQQIAAVSGGKKPTSVEELIAAKPENADLWDKLGRMDPKTQSSYRNILAENVKDDYGPSDKATLEISRMKAMAEDHPAEFTQIDMIKWRDKFEIPRAQWAKMLDLQAEKNRDPTVKDLAAQQAMTYLAPTLPPDFSDKRNHEEYLLFKGVLMDQLQDFYQRNKKPAGLEDIKKMGAQIQSQQHSSEFWFNSSTDKLYKLPTPSKLIEDTKKLEPGITDEEIHRRYIRLQYNDLFNKPKAP